MGAGAYLQAAAGQLQNAAAAVMQEAANLRTELDHFERDATKEIDSKDADSRVHIAEASTADNSQERAQLERIGLNLRNEVNAKKQELDKKRAELTQKIKEKESKANDLKGRAAGLAGEAASLG